MSKFAPRHSPHHLLATGRRRELCCLLALLITWLTAQPALAFPNDIDGACDHPLAQTFEFVGTWPSDQRKNWVRAGILDWNTALDHYGGSLTDFSEVTSDPDFEVSLEELDEGLAGIGNCQNNTLRASNAGVYNSENAMRTLIGRHEAGHIAWLNHTGAFDSHVRTFTTVLGVPEEDATTMNTCEGGVPRKDDLSEDDAAHVTFAHSNLRVTQAGSQAPLTPNLGFEQDLKYWRVYGSGTTQISSTGGTTGARHLEFKSDSFLNDFLYQTVAFSAAPYSRLVTAVEHKRMQSSDTGRIRVELWGRRVVYDETHPSCDEQEQWVNGRNMNERTPAVEEESGNYAYEIMLTDDYNPGTGWTRSESDHFKNMYQDGDQDVQLRVYTDMTDQVECVPTGVRLDNVRLECYQSKNSYEADCLGPS